MPSRRAKPASDEKGPPQPWLRRADQLVIGSVTFLALLSLGVYLYRHSRGPDRLIEIDRAEPLDAAYLVDINACDWPELTQLPEIGETLARRIVESRDQAGPFLDHEDLRRVRGIGPKTLERLKPFLLPMPKADTIAGEALSEKDG